ncbi:MAG: hypothetical protein ABI380_13745 [Edaphobacter sp.]
MNKLRCFRLLLLSHGILAGSLLAQTTSDNAWNSTALPSSGSSVVPTEDMRSNTGEDQQLRLAAALDGTGLISLASNAPSYLLFGATVSGGWDSNPNILRDGVASRFYTVSPYFAIQSNRPKSQYLLQYQITATGHNSNYATQTLNVASLRIIENPTERWNLDFEAKGSYGQDAIRFLGAQQTVAVGQVPGTGPDSASYLTNGGNVTYVSAGFGSTFRMSARNSLQLKVANDVSRYTGYLGSNSIATAHISFDRDLSLTRKASVYVQNSHYYGSLHCESYGGGFEFRWTPRENTSIALGGGPQFDTPECGIQQGFAYSLSMSKSLSGKSQMYLLAARQPATSFLGPGLWQESVSAGYQRQVTHAGAVGFDVGYVRSDAVKTVDSYKAGYFDCVYTYAMSNRLRSSYTYRGYIGGSGGSYIDRNLVMFSLDWTPGRALSFVR